MNILELAAHIGLEPKWKASTAGGEYHSSCPVCGGTDRFYMQPYKQMSKCKGFYSCRQCNTTGDAIQFARQFLNFSFHKAAQTVNATISEDTQYQILKQSYSPRLITLKEPPKKWTETATKYMEQAYTQLLHKKDTLEFLASRGITINIIHQYKFGWSPKDNFFLRSDWGLEEQQSINGKPRKLWIPKGLIIPINKPNEQIVRLKVRRSDWKNGDTLPKYIAISGSMNGLSLIGNQKHTTIVVVESELDAYALNCIVGDFIFVVAVGSNIKNPDNLTDYYAKNASNLLICHDNDTAGKKMFAKWCNLYFHAKALSTPVGKDIGEAIQKDFNIKEWLLQTIKGIHAY